MLDTLASFSQRNALRRYNHRKQHFAFFIVFTVSVLTNDSTLRPNIVRKTFNLAHAPLFIGVNWIRCRSFIIIVICVTHRIIALNLNNVKLKLIFLHIWLSNAFFVCLYKTNLCKIGIFLFLSLSQYFFQINFFKSYTSIDWFFFHCKICNWKENFALITTSSKTKIQLCFFSVKSI